MTLAQMQETKFQKLRKDHIKQLRHNITQNFNTSLKSYIENNQPSALQDKGYYTPNNPSPKDINLDLVKF